MTSVFTADVVEYSFLPEKYAEAQTLVDAEINVIMRKDWQHIVELWFKSGVGAQYKDLLLDAQNTELRFGGSARATDGSYVWRTNEATNYGVTEDGTGATTANAIDKALAKSLLYAIGGAAGFFKGDATLNPTIGGKAVLDQGMRDILQALLTAQTSGAQNALIIDQAKVTTDLSAGSDGAEAQLIPAGGFDQALSTGIEASGGVSDTTAFNADNGNNATIISKIDSTWSAPGTDQTLGNGAQHVSDTMGNVTGRTAVLSQVLNAEAFRPVINRLIAGGNFFVNLADGVKAYSAEGLTDTQKANERKFSVNRAYVGDTLMQKRDDTPEGADKNTQIPYDSELVFPIQINVADVSSYNADGTIDQIDYSSFLAGQVADGAGGAITANGASDATGATINGVKFNMNLRFKAYEESTIRG